MILGTREEPAEGIREEPPERTRAEPTAGNGLSFVGVVLLSVSPSPPIARLSIPEIGEDGS